MDLVDGSQTGGNPPNWGTQGVPAATNTPGALAEVKSGWVDASNNLWMFGGQTDMADLSATLWKYDIPSGMWTWMNGVNTLNYTGNYGTLGVQAPTNQPPARFSYTRWQDGNDNFYLFAGGGGSSMYNDVWRYSTAANQWTWIAGSNFTNDPGSYPPTKCTFYNNHRPPSRIENQTAQFTTGCARAYYTFGGFSTGAGDAYNDLWLFEVDSFRWSWVSGTNIVNDPGVYGTMGLPAPTNMPPARGGQGQWVDNNYNLWIFGGLAISGFTIGYFNDLWRFVPDTSCINISQFIGGTLTPPDTNLCAGDTSYMTIPKPSVIAFWPSTYVQPNADTSVLAFFPPVTTTYTVALTEGTTCTSNDTVQFTIHINPRDTVNLTFPDTFRTCSPVVLAVDTGINYTITPVTGVTYIPGDTTITLSPNVPTTYTITGAKNGSCSEPDTAKVTVIKLSPVTADFTISDDTICLGEVIQFTTSAVGTGPLGYSWNFGDSLTSTLAAPTITYTNPGTYNVIHIVNDSIPCFDTVEKTVIVAPMPSSAMSISDTVLCEGQALSFVANVSVGIYEYTWDFGDGTSYTNKVSGTHAFDTAGSFNVIITVKDKVCPDTTLTKTVTVYPHPRVDIGEDTTMCPYSEPLVLTNIHFNPADRYKWNTGDSNTASIVARHPGIYGVTAITKEGCTGSDSVQILKSCYLDIPNAFTPNGDGINDYFFPRQLLSAALTRFRMQVFNRWGQVIFETDKLDGRGWDGRFNGVAQPNGVYVYVIEADIAGRWNEKYQGNVTLLR